MSGQGERKDGEAGGRCPHDLTLNKFDCPACAFEEAERRITARLPDPAPCVVAECWTCHDNNIRWHRGSHPVQASGPGVQEWIERHRAAGHDVRPVAQTEGEGKP